MIAFCLAQDLSVRSTEKRDCGSIHLPVECNAGTERKNSARVRAYALLLGSHFFTLHRRLKKAAVVPSAPGNLVDTSRSEPRRATGGQERQSIQRRTACGRTAISGKEGETSRSLALARRRLRAVRRRGNAGGLTVVPLMIRIPKFRMSGHDRAGVRAQTRGPHER